ncbi:MAG: hypothetical protein HDS07_04775 [Bacteroides sp.]|nr:hypothetical protein [Bacteroides sp.]
MAVRLWATGDARASESPPGSEGSGTAKCRINAAIPVGMYADGSNEAVSKLAQPLL